MKLEKQLWCLARLALPVLGFVLASSGAYMVSQEDPEDPSVLLVLAYIMVVLGFLLITSGVSWSLCHSMRSKMYHRRASEPRQHIFTVNRPSSFPPSYEESRSYPPSEAQLPIEFSDLAPLSTAGTALSSQTAAGAGSLPLATLMCSDCPGTQWCSRTVQSSGSTDGDCPIDTE